MKRLVSIMIASSLFISSAAIAQECEVTKANYDALQTGMSVEQVSAILKCKGEEVGQTETGGIKILMLQWMMKTGFGGMSVMFQNDEMTAYYTLRTHGMKGADRDS